MGYLQQILLIFGLSLCTSNAQNNGDLRLRDGTTVYEGRLEVYNNLRWGTICDDRFESADANVACRQLGFGPMIRTVPRAGFGRGTGRIWMDSMDCTGSENNLHECPFGGWGRHDCSHAEDIGVQCTQPKEVIETRENIQSGNTNTAGNRLAGSIRLACPPGNVNQHGKCITCYDRDGCPSSTDHIIGIVEIQIKNRWYPISGQSWTLETAKVACGQLGFPVSDPAVTLSDVWPGYQNHKCFGGNNNLNCRGRDGVDYRRYLRTTVLRDVMCAGNEPRISQCYITNTSIIPSDETSDNVAVIRCGYSSTDAFERCIDDNNNISQTEELYRLRAGPVPHMGRVEVRLNGEWGTVCDLDWNIADANIVCRNLGYGTAKRIFTRASFGRGIGPTHFAGLRCTGRENLLSDCPDSTTTVNLESYCRDHTGDVGVECNVPPECPRDEKSRITNTGVELVGQVGWGQVCEDTMDINAATVMCRETMQLFASKISIISGSSSVYYEGSIQCSGEESRLSQCAMSLSTVSKCDKGVVNVTCTRDLPDLVPDVDSFKMSLNLYPYNDVTVMFYLTCAHEEKCLSSSADTASRGSYRTLLRFNSLTMNYGTVDFAPVLDRSNWLWHSCHNHYHSYENFITYDILDSSGKQVAEGHKASFCLEDSVCSYGGHSRYRCSTGIQGISKNCGDLYGRNLDCQWIDITDIVDRGFGLHGKYILRQTVNADRLTPETDYKNNEIECEIEFIGRYMRTQTCRHSDH